MKNKALMFVGIFILFWTADVLLGKRVFGQGVNAFTWMLRVYAGTGIFRGWYNFGRKEVKNFSLSKITNRPYTSVIISGGLGTVISYVGLHMTEAINYAFLTKLSVLFTVLLAHIRFHDEKMTWEKAGLMFGFLVGGYLIATDGNTIAPQIGDMFVILGAFFFAVNNISIKACLQRGIQVEVMLLGRSIMTVLICIGMILLLHVSWSLGSFTWYAVLGALFVCAWLSCLIKTIEHASPSYMVMMSMLNTILLAVGAYMLLAESMSPIQMLGGGVILVSGIVLERRRGKSSIK